MFAAAKKTLTFTYKGNYFKLNANRKGTFMKQFNGLRFLTSACLTLAILVSSSSFVLAALERRTLLGEIVVTGDGENGEPAFVKVDGERAVSGRTFSSSSLIETADATSAGINIGGVARIGLSPNSKLSLNFSENSISGKLYSGKIKVFNAKGVSVNIETPDNALSNNKDLQGNFVIDLESGLTRATAESGSLFFSDGEPVGKAQTTPPVGGGLWIPLTVYGVIVGTAVVSVIVSRNSDDVVSPIR